MISNRKSIDESERVKFLLILSLLKCPSSEIFIPDIVNLLLESYKAAYSDSSLRLTSF